MRPLFPAGPVWITVPDVPGASVTRALLELEAAEMEVELGGEIRVTTDAAPHGHHAVVFEVEATHVAPRVVRDGPIIRIQGASLDGCETALSLLRTMRRRGATDVTWSPTPSLADAVDRLDAEVATTWPSFPRTGIDWNALRARSGPFDDLVDLQRWVARLGDGHTRVHPRTDVAALPYSARWAEQRLTMVDVPEGTAAFEAGVRPGDELLDIDVEAIADVVGAPPHLLAWAVGRAALSGPIGVPLRRRTRAPDGSTRTWDDTPGTSTWPRPIEFSRRPTGTAVLRIRRWTLDDEEAIDDALDELASADRLIVDLRGNAGGMLVAAVNFRRRFIESPTRTGSVRFSTGDGTLSAASHYDDTPSPRTRWLGRTRFLTDALTYSASEDALLGLSQHPRIDVVGQPSGGGSGRARRIPLAGTSVLTVSTALTYDHLGRCVEGNGIAVTRHLDDDQLSHAGADRDW